MIKGNFMRNTDKNDIKKILKSIIEPEIDIKAGKVIEIDNRKIYPIIQKMAVKNENQFFFTVEIFPVALVVEEGEEKYTINLTSDKINSEEIIGMIH